MFKGIFELTLSIYKNNEKSITKVRAIGISNH